MRKIDELVWHCSATPEGREVSSAEITHWHKARGFKTIGYHYLVHLDGTVEKCRDIGHIGAHVAGHNTNTIGACYIGGVDAHLKPKDTRTKDQKRAMRELTVSLIREHRLTKVSGHRDYAAKACPSFDAREEYRRLLH
jgi:hypothetical protein